MTSPKPVGLFGILPLNGLKQFRVFRFGSLRMKFTWPWNYLVVHDSLQLFLFKVGHMSVIHLLALLNPPKEPFKGEYTQ